MYRICALGVTALLAMVARTSTAVSRESACGPSSMPAIHRRQDGGSPHILNIERNLLPPTVSKRTQPESLPERMRYYGVPGVSMAMIHEGKVDWATSWGVRDATTCRPVTTHTAFQAGSVSKIVAAVTALRLVEQGALDLDGDVNNRLNGWQLPRVDGVSTDAVTIRELLSHSAGVLGFDSRGYAEGKSLPTLQQDLDGVPPALSPAVQVVLPPGRQWSIRIPATWLSRS
jgi:CubicO group peptidase (beta-lactamase class C family)